MPGAVGVGDSCFPHCGKIPHTIRSGAPDVLVNGKPMSAVGDICTPHLTPKAKCKAPHIASIITGSPSVVVGGKPAATVGSALLLCTFVISGSPDVIVGA
jgi:uncharacterized Zn-binding protein involved in type VI secretion